MKQNSVLAILGILAMFGLPMADAAAAPAKARAHAAKAAKAKEAKVAEDEDTDSSVPHAGEKPLMVVRFNQPGVAYQWPLYETLTKALEVKPQGEFDIVSVAPKSLDKSQRVQADDASSKDLEKVLATMKEIGMPESRYNVFKVYDNVPTSEVRIYIK